MLWTLQRYIFREMGKTFLLAAVGLTGLLGLGGGVMNMMGLEQLTALDLFRILSLVLPLAAAIALPVAALFSATATYGRLSADNEFVACRASGINIHHLLASALVISVVSSAIGFVCINYLMPGVIRNLDRFVRANLEQIVRHALVSPRRLPLLGERYRIYADHAEVLRDAATNGAEVKDRVVLSGVAFVEMSKGSWVRYGTARTVDLRFSMAAAPTVEADMYGLSWYDRHRRSFTDSEYQGILPYELPTRVPVKLKWMDLSELLGYRRCPEKLPDIQDGLRGLRAGIARALYYDSITQAWSDSGGQRVELGDGTMSLVLSSGNLRTDEEDGRPFLFDGVTVSERRGNRHRSVKGAQATIDVTRSSTDPMGRVTVTVSGGVQIRTPKDAGAVIEKPRERLASFALPGWVVDRVATYSDRWLLSPDAELDLGTWVRKRQKRLAAALGEVRRKIAKEIHSRLALSASTLVLVILGAALGIAFRGAHSLVAFGISAVPTVLVVTIITAGRQMAEKPETTWIGLLVMWGGIVAVGALDAWVLARLVRR